MILPIVLALFGLALIYIEFFIPGGIMGLFGGLLITAAFIIVLISDLGILPIAIFIVVVLVLLVFVIKLAIIQVKKTGKNGTVFLNSDQTGYTASSYNKELVGKSGTAGSDLKPSGYVIIDDKSYQAVSKGKYINKGSKVQVLSGEGARLIVKEKN